MSPSLFSSQMQTDTTGNNVLVIDILTIAYTVQVHQIQCQLICGQNLAVLIINLPLEQASHS